MRNTNLYFGLTAAAEMAFNNHTAQTLQLTKGGFQDPLPAGSDFIANGGLRVTVTYHAEHTYGTAYTAISGEIDITAACTIHPSTGVITIATVAADPVNGWTKSGTGANNDLDVLQLKPYSTTHGIMYTSGKLVGVAVKGGATTVLNFQAKTGKAAIKESITITHATGKHKEFMEDLMDVVADDNKVAGMVVVRDDMRDLSLPTQRGTVIASVA